MPPDSVGAAERARPAPDPVREVCPEAVMFDFDGTLTEQGAIAFDEIRTTVGVPSGRFILEHIAELPEADRAGALEVVERFELEAAARSVPNRGAEEAVRELRALGLPLGIVTRNGVAAVHRAFENFLDLGPDDFNVIVTRDDGLPTKPAPDQLLAACARVGVAPEHTMMVGDFRLDVESGRAAGAITVYLFDAANDGQHPQVGCDAVIDSMAELPGLVRDLRARTATGR